MVSRRRFLSSGAALLTTGCAARAPTGTTEPTETSAATGSPSTTPTQTPTLDCADAVVRSPPKAVVSDDDVTPPSYPAFPDALDADAVASFVSAYETAYAVNALLAGTSDVDHVDVAVGDSPPVTHTPRGYVADLTYRYAVEAETPADYPPRHVAYLVREGVVARAGLDADESPVPFPVARADVFRCES
jgi:hypothetical protein